MSHIDDESADIGHHERLRRIGVENAGDRRIGRCVGAA
jgi:hypothetical protein